MLMYVIGGFVLYEIILTRLEYIGIWEQVYNPNFNYGEFAVISSLTHFH